MAKYDPYVMFPRDLWNNVVVFADMVCADVYLVILNSIQSHMQEVSSEWTEEQKAEFAREYAKLTRMCAREEDLEEEMELEQDGDV